ncbi:MAG: DNA mismatch repair protein MutS [Deltaproteobacteria bacterium]|nr:DNA mismatch repair protein MutS [Deltaproteobacteria bacterium]
MTPRAEYEARLRARRSERAALAARIERVSYLRMAAFGAGLVLLFLAFDFRLVPRWLVWLPAIGFAGLVVAHQRARRAERRVARAVRFYELGVARLDHAFAGQGVAGERFLDPAHPYAADLDLFGRGSLFELLCTARTQAGEETLARWLLTPAAPAEVRARQHAVGELRARLDLREAITLLGEDVRGVVDPAALAAWATAAPWRPAALERGLAAALPVLTCAAVAAWDLGALGPWPMLLAGAAQIAFALRMRARVLPAIRHAAQPAVHLALLADLLAELERATFEAPGLVALRTAITSAGEAPSRRIARLQRLVNLLDAHRNQVFAIVSFALLWRTNFALAIESWRAESGPAVPRWLAAIGELEALLALASHAFEHPDDPFPELVAAFPRFDGAGIGHPLIPEERCVRNDLHLDDGCRVLIVSGSNMSGKSTLLRTVGVNVVLALAGAPVRARRLVLTPFAVGAAIRITDSLQDGTSRFYAEVKRLSRIVDLGAGPLPLLFLLDEILSGTNSHDRAIGAEAIVRTLAARGALGLVTTHDLALARIADGLGAPAANVHFEDHLEDGQMCFDYTMRPGVVTRSNALALMRAVGLEV